MKRIQVAAPEGVRWVPREHAGDGVLVVAGSSGRIDAERAKQFARHGCVAESIRWFGGAGQHDGPWEIPLETFLERVDDLAKDCDRVYLVGTSFGSEAALLCGALSDDVAGAVAFAPSHVVWAGYDDRNRETSHWTLGGSPLPWVPFDWDGYVPESPARFAPVYQRSARTFADRVPAATIPVDRIGNVILVAGGDDQVWPSVEQAERIVQLRASAGLSTTLVTSPDAGHRTVLPGEEVVAEGARMQRGGTAAADRNLGVMAWDAILGLLDDGRHGASS